MRPKAPTPYDHALEDPVLVRRGPTGSMRIGPIASPSKFVAVIPSRARCTWLVLERYVTYYSPSQENSCG
jgi:hypothetical protein